VLKSLCCVYRKLVANVVSSKALARMKPAVAAIAARSAVAVWVVASSFFVPTYDTSSSVTAPHSQAWLDNLLSDRLGRLSNWDGAYFTHLATQGYTTEQFHAFFPLLPYAMRQVA
jgi:GPI mannosyltransferase 2